MAAFLRTELAGAVVLLAAAGGALLWANSPWPGSYDRVWHTELFGEELRHWVNEGLMTLFFLVVGLEVKREVVTGELRQWRTAALPMVAAVGGMVVPACVYLAFTFSGPGAAGWGIPVATDIAFALGVLAIVGRRAHPALKVFLLTLAVADDIGAIVVIAIFYGSGLQAAWLAASAILLAAMVGLWRAGARALPLFAVLGVCVWFTVFHSGVHATVAGVVLGLIAPVRRHREDQREPLAERVERGLHPWTSLAVVPTFAVANSGVRLSGLRLDAPGAKSVAIGTAVALAGGKALGILVGSWVALRTGLGARPEGLMWRDLAGAAACGGVGFTVSLFIAGPAFDDGVLTDAAKLGVLGGSAVAAVLAAAILLPGRKNPVNGSGPAPPPARSG